MRDDENGCRNEEQCDAVDKRRVRAHDELPTARICSDHLMVIINCLIKILERENRLLENFHDGNAAHIFNGFDVHVFERLHVFLHKVLALVHLGTERDDGIGNWDEGYDAKTPIENEHQYERGDGNNDGSCQIRKLVRHEGVCDGGVVVNDFADAAGRVLVEKAKRELEQFFHGDSADVAFDAEGD